MVPSRSVFLALGLPALVRGTQYTLIQEYSGPTFFNGWEFFSNGKSRCVTRFTLVLKWRMSQLTTSPTETRSTCTFCEAECHIRPCSDRRVSSLLYFSFFFRVPHRSFVNAAQATAQKLAFVNSAGNAIMKVDNTTVVPPNSDRNTVRITTTDSFPVGSLWVADMVHVPFGVGDRLSNLMHPRRSRTPKSMVDALTPCSLVLRVARILVSGCCVDVACRRRD